MKPLFSLLLLLLTGPGWAQSPAPAAAGAAAPITSAELQVRLSGKKYSFQGANGPVRIQYDANGTFYLMLPNGSTRSGKWSAEEGRVCSEYKGLPKECNEVRLEGDSLQVKRSDAAWTAMVPS